MDLAQKRILYERFEKDFRRLVTELHCRQLPFNPPIPLHKKMIEELPFEELPPHVQKIATYQKMSKECEIFKKEIEELQKLQEVCDDK